MSEEHATAGLQRTVQRLLGRCLLRLQHYERLMKAMLADHELAGPLDALPIQRATRIEKFSLKTLGTLVNSLFETFVVPEGFERELQGDDVPTDRFSLALSFRLPMEEENWTRTKAAIGELVALRNEMVHHLVERFDLATEEGCTAAISYLEEGYQRIDRAHGELLEWAKAMAQARDTAAAFMQTEAFRDLVFNGIAPDGSFDWPATGIVAALRHAACTLAVDGWARLEDARKWMCEVHPEQTPARYGCRTWPQVLSESRQFELKYRRDEGQKVAWFRCLH